MIKYVLRYIIYRSTSYIIHCTVSVVFTDCTGIGSRRYYKCNTVYPVHTSKNAGIVYAPNLIIVGDYAGTP